MASRPDPNRMLGAALFGEARALAVRAGSIDEAREVLLRLANGRYDLLAQEAGLMAGFWSATVAREHPVHLLAAGLLIVSGPVDFNLVARWVEIGRKRGSAPMYRAQ
jgi:hypothetical protein